MHIYVHISKIYPILEVPFISAVWTVVSSNRRGGLVRNCSVRNGSGLVLQGSGRTPRYVDPGHVL